MFASFILFLITRFCYTGWVTKCQLDKMSKDRMLNSTKTKSQKWTVDKMSTKTKPAAGRGSGRTPSQIWKIIPIEAYETKQKRVVASYVLALVVRSKILNTNNFVEKTQKILISVLKNSLIAI